MYKRLVPHVKLENAARVGVVLVHRVEIDRAIFVGSKPLQEIVPEAPVLHASSKAHSSRKQRNRIVVALVKPADGTIAALEERVELIHGKLTEVGNIDLVHKLDVTDVGTELLVMLDDPLNHFLILLIADHMLHSHLALVAPDVEHHALSAFSVAAQVIFLMHAERRGHREGPIVVEVIMLAIALELVDADEVVPIIRIGAIVPNLVKGHEQANDLGLTQIGLHRRRKIWTGRVAQRGVLIAFHVRPRAHGTARVHRNLGPHAIAGIGNDAPRAAT